MCRLLDTCNKYENSDKCEDKGEGSCANPEKCEKNVTGNVNIPTNVTIICKKMEIDPPAAGMGPGLGPRPGPGSGLGPGTIRGSFSLLLHMIVACFRIFTSRVTCLSTFLRICRFSFTLSAHFSGFA